MPRLTHDDDGKYIVPVEPDSQRIVEDRKDSTYQSGKTPPIEWDCLNDTIKVAIELAEALKRYCMEQNLPKDALISGVAWDGLTVKENAYVAGKESQKDFFRDKLGL